LSRGSGTEVIPWWGWIVEKGYGAISTLAEVRALKIVDLPAFGKPTIPQSKPIPLFPLFLWFDYFRKDNNP
jgi:hypothetical protein